MFCLTFMYIFSGSRYSVVSPAACLEPEREYKIRIKFNSYKTNQATPDATTLIDSVSTWVFGVQTYFDFNICTILSKHIHAGLIWYQNSL